MSDLERERTERTALTGVITCGWGLALNIVSVVTANSLVLVADFFNSFLEFCSVYSPSPNTPWLATGMKARRTLRSLGEGGLRLRRIPQRCPAACRGVLH